MFESPDDLDTLPSSLAAAFRRDVQPAAGRAAAVGAIMTAVRTAPAPRRSAARGRALAMRPMRPRWALRRGALSPAGAVLAACLTFVVGWLGTIGAPLGTPIQVGRPPAGVGPVARTGVAVLRDSILDNALVVAVRDTLRMVRFALEAPAATRVALVGDWGGGTAAVPLRRVAGAWTADVPLRGGRHRYGFVIDDTGWVGRGHGAGALAADTAVYAPARAAGDRI